MSGGSSNKDSGGGEDKYKKLMKEYFHGHKQTRTWRDTLRMNSEDAYNSALRASMLNEKGEVDTDLLDDESRYDKFIETYINHHIEKSAELLGYNPKTVKGDWRKKNGLLKQAVGRSEADIRQFLRTYGKRFGQIHGQLITAHSNQIDQEYGRVAGAKLREHLEKDKGAREKLLKEAGLEDRIEKIGHSGEAVVEELESEQAEKIFNAMSAKYLNTKKKKD